MVMRKVQDLTQLYGTMVAINTIDDEIYFGILIKVFVNRHYVDVILSGHRFTLNDLDNICTLSEWKENNKH